MPGDIRRLLELSETLWWLSEADDGVDARDLRSVARRLPTLGGCGNDAMLTDLRTSFPEGLTSVSAFVAGDRSVGTLGVELV